MTGRSLRDAAIINGALKDISDCPAFLKDKIGDNAGNQNAKGLGRIGLMQQSPHLASLTETLPDKCDALSGFRAMTHRSLLPRGADPLSDGGIADVPSTKTKE